MEIGIIGLGKMGLNLAENMANQEYKVFGMDTDLTLKEEVSVKNIEFVETIEKLMSKFTKRKIIWMMLPAGEITESVFQKVKRQLQPGDYIIDGGNAHFEDSKKKRERV